MKRRTFLHLASLTGLYTLISPKSIVLGRPSSKKYFSENSFQNPPYSNGPYTWWHWMNGNITKSGITKDLEAMKEVGIAGFQLFEAGSGIPLGAVECLGEEWTSLLAHAIKESGRLGLEFAMHNCPGWSSSGGPWITPELSMQELTYSEVRVSGGRKIEVKIPQPPAQLNYYKDTFLIAFPEAHAEGATNENWSRKANFRNQDSGNIGSNKSPGLIILSSVIDLSDRLDTDGFLSWQAPKGDWTIIRFGHTASGQHNHSAPTLGTGLDCDKLSRSALEFHFDKMFSKITPILKSAAKAGKVGLLIDKSNGRYSGTFCISGYFKPEIDIALNQDQFFGLFLTDYYVIFPVDSERIYGKGHAGVGMTVGRNGIVLFERYGDRITAVLSVKIPLSGWTHIVIGYKNNTPGVFINGNFIQKGKKSQYILHSPSAEAAQYTGVNYYNGDIADLKISKNVFSAFAAATKGISGMPKYSFLKEKNTFLPDDKGLLIYRPGQYKVQGKGINFQSVNIQEKVDVFTLPDEWNINFPGGLGAPEEFKIGKLQSLHKSIIEGVRHFSGTASYSIRFEIRELELIGKKYFLDLGRVEVISEVTLNGKSLGILWKRPYKVEVTAVIFQGINELRVEVTNLWPNRLIGDELLPQENEYNSTSQSGKFTELYSGGIKELPDWYRSGKPKPQGGRVTFATWKAYSKDSPLLESGLLGPVAIICVPYINLNIK